MKNLYTLFFLVFSLGFSHSILAQCDDLSATLVTYESRCAATGAIKINATGGSGFYKYKVTGPVSIDYTSTDSITGLSAGIYSVEVFDIDNSCTFIIDDVTIAGNYADPRFSLSAVDVTCDRGNNGSITVQNLQYGREPFTFTIMPPSPSGVGQSNSDGKFYNLSAGEYTVRLTDSCGGIQTRIITVGDYTWWIESAQLEKYTCNDASGWIKVKDSKGNVSTITGIPGMTYGILLDGATDTLWYNDPNFDLDVTGASSAKIFAKDICGTVKYISSDFSLLKSIDDDLTIYDKTCDKFSVKPTNLKNLQNPQFCLYNKNGNFIGCNADGIFTGLEYSEYCMEITDDCADTTITRCFTATPPEASVDDDVLISNKTCDKFDATVTGVKGMSNPLFCLYRNGKKFPLACNATGIFTELDYGYYCINTISQCPDTIIRRCFMVGPPTPEVPDIIIPSYVNCDNFGIDVTGTGLINPTYCLYDSVGNLIECRDTGVFDSIPLGTYCFEITDGCTNTKFTRCITVGPPEAVNDMSINIREKTCSTFTASVSTTNLLGGNFCLYNENDDLIACDSTGVFTLLPYGKYCIKAYPPCPDTVLITCFQVEPPSPAISSSVTIKDRSCTDFTVSVKGQKDLTNPTYYLVDNKGDTLATNTTGTFNKVAYGSYCILVKDGCFDLTLQVCFSEAPPDFKLTATASMSCAYGYSKFTLSANMYPATFSIYSPTNVWLYTKTVTGPVTVDSIPKVGAGEKYMIVAETDCDNHDTVYLSPLVAYFTHIPSTEQKCPGGIWPDGSGNIHTQVLTNTGTVTVRLIKKDGVLYAPAKSPDKVVGDKYTFSDLGPGTYIISYNTTDGCNKVEYDTVTVSQYQFPNLSRSTAYQCDEGGFSVGAVVTYGAGPFTYEIIGSVPSVPSIIAGPQSNPVFHIDNGYNYQLIRLRAVDACGNASLGDASILPLADNSVKVSENCVGQEVSLWIDPVTNSTAKWYYKTDINAQDATYVGDGFKLTFNPLSNSDLGYYYCEVSINDGCVKRTYGFDLDGSCYTPTIDQKISISGEFVNGKNIINWKTDDIKEIKDFFVERKTTASFETIGRRNPNNYISRGHYSFTDNTPSDLNEYRLRLEMNNGSVQYSKTISVQAQRAQRINVYPNPAVDFVNIELPVSDVKTTWQLELMNLMGQKTVLKDKVSGSRYMLRKPSSAPPGMYILRLTNGESGERFNYKIIFRRE
ncbi:MAG: T9SS type A sorting domain-containing protein [Chitinophagaceae bacterium]|nr:T9SS type A sorting domain-containing protein [Chitinophagaceae bacterium]